jgi:16S rRNA (uracil1498-N3)-methyltransferase
MIVLLDGRELEADVELVEVSPRFVRGLIHDRRLSVGEPRLDIALYQGLVSREKLESVLQKGTEVGVSSFVPIECARSLVPADSIDQRRLERWRRIVREAAEQARRGRVPVVRQPLQLPNALAEATAAGPTLLAWEGERRQSAACALQTLLGVPLRELLTAERPEDARPILDRQADSVALRPRRCLNLFVGPEGGFTAEEVGHATALGAISISLGPRILRTETAGPVLAALALFQAGEMEPVAERCPRRSVS